MKDSAQKQKAIRYCVAMGLVPCMEALVRYEADVADVALDITDVDVLGVHPSDTKSSYRVVFDCKTLNKVSGINRAIWAAGLKDFIGASEAFVILSKPAPEGHRLAASRMGVRLFAEPLFDRFASAASSGYFPDASYLESLQAWEDIFAVRKANAALIPFVDFLTATAPLQSNSVVGFRSLLVQLKRAEGELDPTKPAHRALYGVMLSQALMFLADMVCSLHSIFDPEAKPEAFDRMLRYFIWGGREGYDLRHRLNQAIKSAQGITEPPSFEFPNWEAFKEVIRSYMDAPFAIGDACLPIKDVAFRELGKVDSQIDRQLSRRLTANNRIVQYILILIDYFSGMSRLTRDFGHIYSERISEVASK